MFLQIRRRRPNSWGRGLEPQEGSGSCGCSPRNGTSALVEGPGELRGPFLQGSRGEVPSVDWKVAPVTRGSRQRPDPGHPDSRLEADASAVSQGIQLVVFVMAARAGKDALFVTDGLGIVPSWLS